MLPVSLRKTFCCLIFTLVLSGAGIAQEATKANNASERSIKKHNVGAAAGFISGYGLTYRHWGPYQNGYQVTLIPVGSVTEDENFANISIGGMGLRALHQTRTTNFFAYYGGHYNFTYSDYKRTSSTTYYYDYNDDETTHNVFAGGGVGIELHFWNLNYSLMFGYAANAKQARFPNGRYGDSNTNPIRTFRFQPSVETGLFYCF